MFQLMFLIMVYVFTATSSIANGGGLLYVVPEEKQCEDIRVFPCNILQEYAKNSSHYFATNTMFLFLPGTHMLTEYVITVNGTSNITLRAAVQDQEGNVSTSIPTVNCNGSQAGFVFRHIVGLNIGGLKFTQCGFPYSNTTNSEFWGGTLVLEVVTNFRMQNVSIEEGLGYGIHGYNVLGNCSIVNSSLDRNKGKVINATTLHGGNMLIIYFYDYTCTSIPSYFYINSTNFTHGQAFKNAASGLNLVLLRKSGSIKFILSNVAMAHNRGTPYCEGAPTYGGANFAMQMSISSESSSSVSFLNCKVENGSAYLGGGIFFSIFQYRSYRNLSYEREIITIINTTFVNNTAQAVGAGLYMRLHDYTELYQSPVIILLKNCNFSRNQVIATTEERGGAAVNIVVFKVPANELHSTPQYVTTFIQCIFRENSFVTNPHTMSYVYGALYIEEHPNVTFENCTIINNNCTGIAAVHTYMVFIAWNVIEKNRAENGGGLMLGDNSIMYFHQYAEVSICHNYASGTGGGIYVQYESLHAIRPCFFQLDTEILLNQTLWETIHIQLQDNTADLTGTALYGGGIDSCYYLTDNNPFLGYSLEKVMSGDVFNSIFNYSNQTGGKAAISSNPVRVCFCNPNMDCEQQNLSRKIVSPGEDFNISVVVVGQRNGVVPGVVIGVVTADIHTQEHVNITLNEITQRVGYHCTPLTYTLYSNKEQLNVNLELSVLDSTFKGNSPMVPIQVTACPAGFTLNNATRQCECVHRLKVNRISCNAHSRTIYRPANSWIGYNLHNNSKVLENNSKDIIFIKYCPHLYCSPHGTEIKAFPNRIDQDQQCSMNRAGTICGGCSPGYSIVFGTPRCVDCKNCNVWRTFGIVCIVALAGLVLVLFLMVFNLTIAEGTINGLILYANIVEANQDLYFPLRQNTLQDSPWYFILRTFIAWLNLDMGIQTCFYNGMDMYMKTWLQFIFPLYIWFIAGLLIWLSRKYNCMAKIMQNNGTKIIATLILLSYAKLLRAIIIGFYSYSLQSDEQTTLVWYLDGNVPYLTGKHVVLFTTAAIFSVILIPFTVVLLFIKHLPKLSSLWVFKWVNKLKPFFDVYTGAYNDNMNFWQGFLLLIRIFLLICAAACVNTTVILMQIVGICAILLTVTWLQRSGIHKKHSLDILEAWLILNLLLWSVMTAYADAKKDIKFKCLTVLIFAGPTFLTFVGVLCYHGYKLVSQTRIWRHLTTAFIGAASTMTTPFKPILNVRSHANGQADNMQEGTEQENLLASPPPVANYSELREPLIDK